MFAFLSRRRDPGAANQAKNGDVWVESGLFGMRKYFFCYDALILEFDKGGAVCFFGPILSSVPANTHHVMVTRELPKMKR